ncbi:hypothetical protein J6X90_01195 [Candidatus Saccharibacteria bacterium]|nr:hypothetical protein [Candidatus Saccharibacteria bacterium]
MIIIGALVAFFILFFVLKKHVGPAHLAMIAGMSVYDSFGKNLVDGAAHLLKSTPRGLLEVVIFLVLVLGLPLLLYIRSGRGGLFGILRIIEAAVFSALLVSICSWCISYFVPLDSLSTNILNVINSAKGIIVITGIAFAYFDILIYREDY